VAPSDEERLLVVRDMEDGTWSMDKYALKEYVKAVEGELGVDPRTARLYDELADFAAKDAPATVSSDAFRGGYMMRYGAHLLPFAHGQMLNLEMSSTQPYHVKAYAAFEDEQYVQRLFETDALYRAALVTCLYAHYRRRKGQYAPLHADYDAKPEYVVECASSTPTGIFDSFWKVDDKAPHVSRSAKDMFEEMRLELSAKGEQLPWRSAKSLGKYLSQRFNGSLGSVPGSEDNGHGAKLWSGFLRADDA
jgi:hypothetical protein